MSRNELAGSYCNPLPIPAIPVGRNSMDPGYTGPWWREFGDPTVIRFKGKYYLFPSCGMVWSSDDLLSWTHHDINLYDVGWAPTVTEKDGFLYLTASWEGSQIWKTVDPLGHWECLGPIRDEKGEPLAWADPALFTDTDGTMYAYYSLGVNRGIFAVPLREDDPTRFAQAPVHCFAYNPANVWERFGEFNQNAYFSHLEGASMTLRGGRYYLQYSAAGAEWRNYSVGCYVADSPLGPFQLQKLNPILLQRGGMVNGCGHNSMVEDANGQWWCFYTILFRRFRGLERRIGMDPVYFDEEGEMWVDGPSETPRFLDGSYPDVLPVSSGQPVKASSFAAGHEPQLALDNYIRTYYEAEPGDPHPTLTVNLQGLFILCGARVIFQQHLTPRAVAPAVFCYRIESSCDGENWQILCDRSNDTFDGHIRYETWSAVSGEHVRLVILGAPKDSVAGVMDFCVFGRFPG